MGKLICVQFFPHTIYAKCDKSNGHIIKTSISHTHLLIEFDQNTSHIQESRVRSHSFYFHSYVSKYSFVISVEGVGVKDAKLFKSSKINVTKPHKNKFFPEQKEAVI